MVEWKMEEVIINEKEKPVFGCNFYSCIFDTRYKSNGCRRVLLADTNG